MSSTYTGRVANSHAYGVILTHLTCYSCTHAIDKFTHAFKKNHTHTHVILKNRKYSTICYHCKTNCNIVCCFLAAESFVISFIQVFPVGKSKKYNKTMTISLYSAKIEPYVYLLGN